MNKLSSLLDVQQLTRLHVLSYQQAEDVLKRMLDLDFPEDIKESFDAAYEFLERYHYFVYPASVKYHLNQPGGLFRHSVKVALNALAINEVLYHLEPWKVVLAGLFHDLGKVGNVDFYDGSHYPRYEPDPVFQSLLDQGHQRQDDERIGFSFVQVQEDWPKHYPFRYIGDQGVRMNMTVLDGLLPAKIMDLPADVVQACIFADGPYVSVNDDLRLKVTPLAQLMHTADYHTGILEEGGHLS